MEQRRSFTAEGVKRPAEKYGKGRRRRGWTWLGLGQENGRQGDKGRTAEKSQPTIQEWLWSEKQEPKWSGQTR